MSSRRDLVTIRIERGTAEALEAQAIAQGMSLDAYLRAFASRAGTASPARARARGQSLRSINKRLASRHEQLVERAKANAEKLIGRPTL